MTLSTILSKNNNNLDLIRIILACLVIVGHSPTLNGGSDYWIDPIKGMVDFTYSGALAVKIFFFISGILVTNSWLRKRNVAHFVISRFFRLMPALFFVLMITVFVFGPVITNLSMANYFSGLNDFEYITNNLVFNTDYTLPGMFTDNVYKNAVNGSLWSLTYEVACYAVLLGIGLLLGERNKVYLNIPILLLILDSILPTKIAVNVLGENPEINLLPVSFSFGAFYAVNADKIQLNLKMVFGLFLIFYVFRNTIFAEVIFIFSSCNLAIYLASSKFILKLKPKYDVSYGIYLWGFLIQQTVFFYIGNVYIGLHCGVTLVISTILALITHWLVEKPGINLGGSIFELYNRRVLKLNKESVPAEI